MLPRTTITWVLSRDRTRSQPTVSSSADHGGPSSSARFFRPSKARIAHSEDISERHSRFYPLSSGFGRACRTQRLWGHRKDFLPLEHSRLGKDECRTFGHPYSLERLLFGSHSYLWRRPAPLNRRHLHL